jgi:hypothetical protein
VDVLEKRESRVLGRNRTRVPRLSIPEPGRNSDCTTWLAELHKHVLERTLFPGKVVTENEIHSSC